MAAPDPAAPRKRKAAPTVDESASKKPKLVKEVTRESVAKPIAAKAGLRKPSVLESMMARFPAPMQPKSGLQPPVELPNVAGARKVYDKADARVDDQIEKAEAKVGARPEERAVKTSTKRKTEDTLPRPAKKQQGNAAPIYKGLQNFHRACYANSVIQCLDTIPELVGRLRRRSRGTLENVKLRRITDAALLKLQGKSRAVEGKKQPLRDIFGKSKEKM